MVSPPPLLGHVPSLPWRAVICFAPHGVSPFPPLLDLASFPHLVVEPVFGLFALM